MPLISSGNSITSPAQIKDGTIINADIDPAAAIAWTKINSTGVIANADVNAAAAIVDTKLATISTAGKVSGAALTSLASIPVGAGLIPTANLPSIAGGTFGRLITSVTVDSAVVNTTETDILSCSLTGGKLGANGMIRFRAFMSFTTANSANPLVTIKLYIGATVVGSFNLAQGVVTSRTYYGFLEGLIQNDNATNAQSASFSYFGQVPGGSDTYTVVPWISGVGGGGAAEDTTTTLTIKATATWSSNNRGSLNCGTGYFEMVPVLP
jgi:hypothetical protein